MLTYNKEENVLYAYQSQFREPIPEGYVKSPDKLSYDDYFGRQIYEDIKEHLMPAILKMCGLEADSTELYIQDMKKEVSTDFRGNKNLQIKVKFGSYKSGGSSEYITVFKAPVMDDFGVLNREGSDYSVIKLLEQDEVVSYEPDKKRLKLKLPKGDISIKAGSKEPVFNISRFKQSSGQKNFSTLNVLFAMCESEGIDARELYGKFMSHQLSNRFNDGTDTNERLKDALEYLGGNVGSVNAMDYFDMVLPAINSEQYNVLTLRDTLNRVLSLDRALGKILDESIKLPNMELPIGTPITRQVINLLKANHVTEIYVKHVPNMLGYYTAQMINIPVIKRGTKIIDIIRPFLPPEENGMYVTKDYVFSDLGMKSIYIPEGTLVSEGFIEMLSYNEFPDVVLKQREDITDPSRFVKVNFRYEVLTNHHSEVNGKWYYVDEAGGLHPQKEYLTAYDIAALLSLTSRLFVGMDLDIVDNADMGFRKRVVMPGELFHRAFISATKKFQQIMNYKFREIWNSNDCFKFFVNDEMENQFWGLTAKWWEVLRKDYRCLELLDIDDKTNPVSYISALTKIVTYVKDKNSIADSMRTISLGQFGRIDTYESPQSRKLGVVNNLASGVIIKDGMLYTQYRKVMHIGKDSYITDDVVTLSVEDEENYRIADLASLVVNSEGKILNQDRVLCRVPEVGSISKQMINYVEIESIDYVNVTPNQFLSWATATIPFMGSNDAVRATFGIAQTKQAKGLVDPDVPRIMTSANKIIPRLNTNFCIFAEDDGVILKADREHIVVLYNGQASVKEYRYKMVESALYSCTVRTTLVHENDTVKKGQMLMTSNFVKEGFLAMGKNALVAYAPNGFNYEDGNFAATRLCNSLTSYRINHDMWENEDRFDNIAFTDVEHLRWCSPNVPLFKIKGYKGSKAPHDRRIYPDKVKGFLNSVKVKREKSRQGRQYIEGIEYSTVSIDSLVSGDKLTNRHGNKGVVPQKIVKVFDDEASKVKQVNNADMFRLRNGEFIDLVYNPLGVVSRMNTGQNKECNLGLALHVLDTRVLTDSFNCISNREIEMLLSYAYDLANTDNEDAVFAQYPEIPQGLHEHCKRNIQAIRFWRGVFDKDGCAYLINPKNGNRETETKVLIGVEYIYKLVQESDKKIHVRGGMPSGEPYLEITNGPTKSASNKGGQRFGTMEMDALGAYGAAAYIWELMNLRGDNFILRNNMVAEKLHRDQDAYYIPDNLECRRSAERFVSTMLALGVYSYGTYREIPRLEKKEIEGRYAYTKNTLLTARDKPIEKRSTKPVEEAGEKKHASNLSEALNNLNNVKDMFKRG